jgi:hypothetical protein
VIWNQQHVGALQIRLRFVSNFGREDTGHGLAAVFAVNHKVAIQKRFEQAGVRYRLHPPITFLTRSLVAGMPSPSTLPIKSAEANWCRFACNSSGSTRIFVP